MSSTGCSCSAVLLSGLDRPLHGQPSPHDRLHPHLYLAEAAGTALLVCLGLSLVILFAALLPPTPWQRALTGACFGTVGALIALSPLGRISGAHINPAVTLAFWLERKLAWRDMLGYVLAQMTGAALGAAPLLCWGAMGRGVNYGATSVGAGVPVWLALAGETVASAALVLAIFITAAHERSRRFTPWTIPPLFAWLVWWEAPLSGASANPARSFGPALYSGQWGSFWIYVVGPLLGATLAVFVLQINLLGEHHVPVARVGRHE
jgi:aquaporin Z